MERRRRVGSEDEGKKWTEGEFEGSEKEIEGGSCVLHVWCGSDRAGQMVSMNRI